MRRAIGIVWLAASALSAMKAEARRQYPLETGGLLLGYWARPYDEVVITDVIGPGPHAVHEPRRFVPDASYQEEVLAQRYLDAPQLYTYLGDWHSHPHAGIRLSPRDRRTLQEIAHHAAAHAPVPLMAILGGRNVSWRLGVWRFVPRSAYASRGQNEFSLLRPHMFSDNYDEEGTLP